MIKTRSIFWMALLLYACQSADIQQFDRLLLVTMGDSLTMGIQNMGVCQQTQLDSYPNLLATQLRKSFGEEQVVFALPLLDEYVPTLVDSSVIPTNLGVGGAQLHHLFDTSAIDSTSNDDRVLQIQLIMSYLFAESIAPDQSQLELAQSSIDHYKPELDANDLTMVILWIGSNDFIECLQGCLEEDALTPAEEWKQDFHILVDTLRDNNPENFALVVINIPYILEFATNFTKEELAVYLPPEEWGDLLDLIPDDVVLGHETGGYPFITRVADRLKENDLEGLTDLVLDPQIVITPEEQALVNAEIEERNQYIKNLAEAYDNVYHIDIAQKLRDYNEDLLEANGRTMSSIWGPQGGYFSLDGMHPSVSGNAVITNAIIEYFNNEHGWGIEPVDMSLIEARDPFATDQDGDGFAPHTDYSIFFSDPDIYSFDDDDTDPLINPLSF